MKSMVSAADGRAASARVLAHIEQLVTIRVAELHCKAHKSVNVDSLTLLTRVEISSTVAEESLATYSHYRVTAVDEDDADEPTPENTVWSVEATIVAHWSLKEPGITKHDAQCFAIGQGALTCHPYARELVQTATSRMSYPPATLDLIFNLWTDDSPDVEIDSDD